MSGRLDKKLEEFATWYKYNEGTIPRENLPKRIDFYEKAMASMFDILVQTSRDLADLEGPRRRLWLPKGMELHVNGSKVGDYT